MILAAVLGALAATADEPSHDVVPDDVFTLDGIGDLAINRNGTTVVFVRSRWSDEEDGRVGDLWSVDARGTATRRLTFLDGHVHDPALTRDGAWIYFVSEDDDGLDQVFRVPFREGATPKQLTHAPDGIDAFDLDQGGSTLWFATTTDVHGDDRWESLRDGFADLTYVDRKHARTTVHALDLATWRSQEVWSPDAYILAFDVTERGDRLAAITAPDEALITHEGGTDVRVVELATGAETRLVDDLWRAKAPSPYGWLHSPAWSSDGRALAFRVDFDGFPGETFVAELAGDEAPLITRLARPKELHPIGAPHWVPDNRELCVKVADHARARISCVSSVRSGKEGRRRMFPKGDVVVEDWGFSGDGRDVYAVVGTPARFPDLYRLPARGNLFPVQVTDLNPHTDAWKLPKLHVVSWTAPDGTTVSGVLETPPGWTKDQGPLPTVVHLHGGPTWHTPFARTFRYRGRTAFAAAGYAVLSPNYRGSVGYGDAFLTGLVGHEADVEVADILSGVDELVQMGIADPDRLGIGGWSNGGFLTNAVVAATDRFGAASSGAGVADQLIQWSLEDTPGHVINFMQGQPWEVPDAYAAASPLRMADRIRTPMILHVGENDARVPAAHARALFRALDTYTEVPAELVVYPDTGHGLKKRSHWLAKLTWDLAWYDHWLRGEGFVPPAEPEAPPAEPEAPPASAEPADTADEG